MEDRSSRQAQFSVTAPACVLQAALPQLLSSGLIEGYEVARPLAAWVPTVADEGFAPGDPGVPARVNAAAREAARASLDLFRRSSGHMLFPGDLVPILPMGTYVTFRLRCRLDDLVPSLPAMVPAAGVAELRFALAAAAAAVYRRWGDPAPVRPA